MRTILTHATREAAGAYLNRNFWIQAPAHRTRVTNENIRLSVVQTRDGSRCVITPVSAGARTPAVRYGLRVPPSVPAHGFIAGHSALTWLVLARIIEPASKLVSLREKSFRMSKRDLQARPVYHHLRDSIQAHLTTVFADLAVNCGADRGLPGRVPGLGRGTGHFP
jgi:hypothetical protein